MMIVIFTNHCVNSIAIVSHMIEKKKLVFVHTTRKKKKKKKFCILIIHNNIDYLYGILRLRGAYHTIKNCGNFPIEK